MHPTKVFVTLSALLLSSTAFAESGINTATGSFDFRFTWRNTSTNATIVSNSSSFTFQTTFVPGTPRNPCAYGQYCRTGTFTTADGGTGTVNFTVTGNGAGVGNKYQHLVLTYDVTGAVYTGTIRILGDNLYAGTMSFPSNPNFAGTFTQTTSGIVALSAETLGDSSGFGLETLDALQSGTLDEADLAYDDGAEPHLESSASCATTPRDTSAIPSIPSIWTLVGRR